jgi:hypothetical protein
MVQMQKEATWEWENIKLATSEVQWENFCQAQDAGGQLRKPANNAASQVEDNVQACPSCCTCQPCAGIVRSDRPT